MRKLDNFIDMMTGHFNNKEQFEVKYIPMQNTLIQSVMEKF